MSQEPGNAAFGGPWDAPELPGLPVDAGAGPATEAGRLWMMFWGWMLIVIDITVSESTTIGSLSRLMNRGGFHGGFGDGPRGVVPPAVVVSSWAFDFLPDVVGGIMVAAAVGGLARAARSRAEGPRLGACGVVLWITAVATLMDFAPHVKRDLWPLVLAAEMASTIAMVLVLKAMARWCRAMALERREVARRPLAPDELAFGADADGIKRFGYGRASEAWETAAMVWTVIAVVQGVMGAAALASAVGGGEFRMNLPLDIAPLCILGGIAVIVAQLGTLGYGAMMTARAEDERTLTRDR